MIAYCPKCGQPIIESTAGHVCGGTLIIGDLQQSYNPTSHIDLSVIVQRLDRIITLLEGMREFLLRRR